MKRLLLSFALLSFGMSFVAAPAPAQAAAKGKHSALKFGVFARLKAKEGKEADVAAFLESAVGLANKEAGTVVWYAIKFDEHTFGIFDAFTDEAGRKAHLSGAIAAALGQKAAELFSEPPAVEQVEILGSK